MGEWTSESWLSSTEAELYRGTEDITSPASHALLVQAGLVSTSDISSSTIDLKILDNGCGLGQLSEVLLREPSFERRKGEIDIVCGDVDESLLEAVRDKADKNGWRGVQVKKNDTHVRRSRLERNLILIDEKLESNHSRSWFQAMDLPDETFTHVFGSFVYMLMPKPIDALQGMSTISLVAV